MNLTGKLYALGNEIYQEGRKNRKPITTRPDMDGIMMARRIAASVNLLETYSTQELEKLDKENFRFSSVYLRHMEAKNLLLRKALMLYGFSNEDLDKIEKGKIIHATEISNV